MIKEKLERYFKGICTPEERAEVVDWLANEENRKEATAYIESKWTDFEAHFDEPLPAFEHIDFAEPNAVQKPKWYKDRFAKVAACAAIAILVGVFFIGKKRNSNGTLITVQTEMGERKWVRLGDGSEVYLNANTRLVYPSEPTLTEAVYVEGEAFFKMAQHNRPMKIKSGSIETLVTASAFNISAFPKDSTMTLAVNKGNAEIRSSDQFMPLIKLRMPKDTAQQGGQADFMPLTKHTKPDTTPLIKLRPVVVIDKYEYAVVHKAGKQVEIHPTKDERKLFGWKDGFMYFDNADTTEIANKLERWYGVQVEFCASTQKLPAYSAEFQNNTITDVLKQLSAFLRLDCRVNGNRVFLCPQKPG